MEFSWRDEQEKTRLWQLRLERYVINIERKVDKIMADLTALQAAVTAEDTVIASVLTLIQGLAAQIAALPLEQPAIDALAADVNNQATALAAAVTANTPTPPVSGAVSV